MEGKRTTYELAATAIERRGELLPALARAKTAHDIRRIIMGVMDCTHEEAVPVELLQLMRFTDATAHTLRESIPDTQNQMATVRFGDG